MLVLRCDRANNPPIDGMTCDRGAEATVVSNEHTEPGTRELFAEHDLRCTPQRKALYEALRSCRDHPTVEELHQRVTQHHDMSISLATVYNTVEVLCKAGLAKRLPTDNGSCRYDAEMGEHLHVRFVDTAEILDVPQELSEKILGCLRKNLIEQVREQLRVNIESVSIQLLARRGGPEHNGCNGHTDAGDTTSAEDAH